jgi:inner membrane protein
MAVGWAVTDPVVPPRRRAVEPIIFGAVAAAPDLDLLIGLHRMYVHSIGATVAVLIVARLALGPGQWRLALAVAAAWGSHLVLDWLGNDTSAPYGLMALWPFTDAYYQSSLHLFDAVSRRYWLPQEFIWHNLAAALKEVVVVGPFALASYLLARWRRLRA